MVTPSYDLTRLDTNTFEHLANVLVMKILGPGLSGFGPGADGGRDGIFEGTAPYPSENDNWGGVWYIQSKFLAPTLHKDPQKWLLDRISEELDEFAKPHTKREWPNNWIIVTNIDPSGTPLTGAFDRAKALVKKVRPSLASRFHIWGGRKVLDLLSQFPDVSSYYAEFVTSGQVLTELYKHVKDSNAHIKDITRYLVLTQFTEQQYTKLEQAGSTTDNRPGIHVLFNDVPFRATGRHSKGMAAVDLSKSLANHQQATPQTPDLKSWETWRRDPTRARVWFIKGGPGQGKSTLTQYTCQIQRAALILGPGGPNVTAPQKALAEQIRETAFGQGLWPLVPRVPLSVELKEFAYWYGRRREGESKRILSYLAEYLTRELSETVLVGTLKRAFGASRWLFIFDGLDEVPGDVKDEVGQEVTHFVNDVLVGCNADSVTVCTSRPQGYSNQFANLDAAIVELVSLDREQALSCATPLLRLDRSKTEARQNVETLRRALESSAIAEIMTTPLQAHIMAVIVRDGGRPPERRWQLFDTFYQVIKKREANKNFPDEKLARLLREGDTLLKTLHNRLGFELHARAEKSDGAVTSLARAELRAIVEEVVSQLQDTSQSETVDTLMRATTDRLVLVNTPEASDFVRFDIRPLQEFFAAEHLYRSGEPEQFEERLRVIAGDSHWREVIHFLLSALIENTRKSELAIAIDVLAELDDGEPASVRKMNRRLARGGLACRRLLNEGVLEQDKRIRGQFKRCLVPLLGCTDAASFLIGVKSEHSRSWLIDLLVASLHELSEAENVGAATALAFLLLDKDTRSRDVLQYVVNTSQAYQNFFCKRVWSILDDEDTIPQWVQEVALRQLLKDDWWSNGEVVIRAASSILLQNKKSVRHVGRECGLTSDAASLLEPFLRHADTREHETDVRRSAYGIVTVIRVVPNKAIEWKSWSKGRWAGLANSSGFLRTAYHVFELARSPVRANAQALVDNVGGNIRNLELLPDSMQAFLSQKYITSTTILDAIDERLFEKNYPGRVVHFELAPSPEEGDWNALIEEMPLLAFSLLSDRPRRFHSASFKSIENATRRTFVEAIELNRDALMKNTRRWGYIFNLPDGLGSSLRGAALRLAEGPVIVHSRYWGEVNPFEIELDKETEFLPHIISGLIYYQNEHPGYLRTTHTIRQSMEGLVKEYVDKANVLLKISFDHGRSKRTRAAAVLLYLRHPQSVAQSRNECMKMLPDLFEPTESEWFLPAAASIMTVDLLESKGGLETIVELIGEADATLAGREGMEPFFRTWREHAKAPVHRLANKDLWK